MPSMPCWSALLNLYSFTAMTSRFSVRRSGSMTLFEWPRTLPPAGRRFLRDATGGDRFTAGPQVPGRPHWRD